VDFAHEPVAPSERSKWRRLAMLGQLLETAAGNREPVRQRPAGGAAEALMVGLETCFHISVINIHNTLIVK
jgi:hypothetical protein